MHARVLAISSFVLLLTASVSTAQEPDQGSRQALVEDGQASKAEMLRPYLPTGVERLMARVEDMLAYRTITWHPYFETAAHGGGLPLGLGYLKHVTAYNYIDVRASYTTAGYKRAETEFVAPRLFKRRGQLSVIGGWRDATQVAFYGVGSDSTLEGSTHYGFKEGYGSATLTVLPTRRFLTLRGGAELARWSPENARGSGVEDIYTPSTLAGLGATTTYIHTQATAGFDWRPAPGYARRGGFYGVTAHDYTDRDDRFGFREVDYEAVQHFPILREAWVISLRGLAETTFAKDGQDVPYYMLPHLGGGSNLRGFDSWRFRDRNKLLLQAEWRIMVNRFLDTALFYDAGKVAARTADLTPLFDGLKHDYGFGARFHAPFQTALRIDVARSNEGTRLIFSTSTAF